MRFLPVPILFGLFGFSAAQLTWRGGAGQSHDAATLVPAMLKSVDRMRTIDPLNVFNDILNAGRKTFLTHSESDHQFNLTLPAGLDPLVMSTVQRIYERDTLGLLDRAMDDMDRFGELRNPTARVNFIIRYFLAAITPIFGASNKCLRQGLAYFEHLIPVTENGVFEEWALRMLDADGKTPDGVLADMTDFCTILDYFVLPNYCDVKFNLVNWPIPKGNTKAFGSFRGCLKVEARRNESSNDPISWEDFEGKMCMVSVNPRSQYISQTPMEKGFEVLPYAPRVGIPLGVIGAISNPESSSWSEMYIGQMNVQFGLCIPNGCDEQDIINNFLVLWEGMSAYGKPTNCEDKASQEKFKEYDTAAVAAISVFSILAFLMALGTLIDVYQQFYPAPELPTSESKAEPYVFTLLKCFSINLNGLKLLNTSRKSTDHLGAVGGIRVFSMLWVALGHLYISSTLTVLKNPKKAEDLFLSPRTMGAEIVSNAWFSVDSFFFLSGLLLAYISFAELEKRRFNLLMFYVHRYIRLTIPVAFWILFTVGLYSHIGDGLRWSYVLNPVQYCKDNWWTNLLYVNNFVHIEEMCLGVTWYLAADTQMYVFSPLVVLPMYYLRKSWMGLAWWGLNMVVFTIVPMALTIKHGLPPGQAIIYQPKDDFSMSSDFYFKPWTHMQPFLMGILLGYVLWRTKGHKINIHWTTNVLMWFVSLASGFAVLFGLSYAHRHSTLVAPAYTPVSSALYQATNKLLWGGMLFWVIFACSKGYGGVINSFLSWGFFKVLARLSYMFYLLHFGFMSAYFVSLNYTVELTDIIYSYYFVGFVMIGFGIAFVAALTIEAPFVALEKLLLGGLLRKTDPPAPTKTTQEVVKGVPEQTEKVPEKVEGEDEKKLPPSSSSASSADIEEESSKSNSGSSTDITVRADVHSSSPSSGSRHSSVQEVRESGEETKAT